MSKHFGDLSAIPSERLEQDLTKWETIWVNAQTDQGEAHAKEVVDELREAVNARESREKSK